MDDLVDLFCSPRLGLAVLAILGGLVFARGGCTDGSSHPTIRRG